MNAQDLDTAANAAGMTSRAVCFAISTLLPVFEAAEEKASRWKPWERLGIRLLLRALREYQSSRCDFAGR